MMTTGRRIRCSASQRGAAGTTLVGALMLVLSGCATAPVDAQVVDSEEHRFRVVTVVSGLSHPWGIAFLPNGDLLVTERPGRLRLIRDGALVQQPVAGTPEVRATGQGGLLEIALHPDFAENQLVYLAYSKPGPQGAATAIARARYDGGSLVNFEDVIVTDTWGTGGVHFGARIVFDAQRLMYIGLGERGQRNRAQELSDHKGTLLRLHDDGRVPQDNPFVGRENARPEIFSYGHRNIQGMFIHPETGEIWVQEHGARGGDEINIARPGRNYGWPVITHGVDYSGAQITPDTARAGMEQPILHWTPSIAPSGMVRYTGDRFPRWRGHVFNGALAGEQLRRVVFDGTRAVHQESMLRGRARIRTVAMSPDGYLYLLTDASNGAVLRLEPVR